MRAAIPWVLASAVGVYLLLLGYMFVVQRSLLFLPDRTPPDLDQAGVAGLMEAVEVTTADGLRLAAWYAPPPGSQAPVMLYLHGNAGHIGHRGGKVRAYIDAGWGVLLLEYRGYGANPGSPTEQGLYADARAALDFLQAEGVDAGHIVLYGESLGAAVAVQMATERPAAALVLEAPFCSVGASAVYQYPIFPMARWLVRDKFDSLSKMSGVHVPLLILHGERDRVTPARFGRALLAAANEPKESRFYPEGGHVGLEEHGATEVVLDFVGRWLGPR
jgi:fermentation-respiration switch protein FrsA (DUF1100 family)